VNTYWTRGRYPTAPPQAHLDKCVSYGAEIGSTGVVVKWSLPDDCVIGQQL